MKSTNDPIFQIEKSKLEQHLSGLIRQTIHEFICKNKLSELNLNVHVGHLDGGDEFRATSVKVTIII